MRCHNAALTLASSDRMRMSAPLIVTNWDHDSDRVGMRRDGEPTMTGATGIADAMMAAMSRGAELHIPTSIYHQLRDANVIPRDLPPWIQIV